MNEQIDIGGGSTLSNELKPILKTNTLKIPSITYENYMRYPGLLKRHNVPALKQATREYKLRIGGRKADVIERLVNYFNTNASALRIQTCFRSWISRYIVRLRGPAYMDKSICVNDTDFCSMEPLSEIESNYFFSFTDSKQFTYGFNVSSLIEMLKRSENINTVLNPYTRDVLSPIILKNIVSLYNLSFILCPNFHKTNLPYIIPKMTSTNVMRARSRGIDYEPITRTINSIEDLTRYNHIRQIRTTNQNNRISELFIEIDLLGNYTNKDWFINLEIRGYIRLYRTLYEIWYYRSNLSREVQNNICPYYAPFDGIFTRPLLHSELGLEQIKTACLIVFENMVYSGINIEYRKIGTLHALSALTLVSLPARESMPWLYESVNV
jgi:hypothetical protein